MAESHDTSFIQLSDNVKMSSQIDKLAAALSKAQATMGHAQKNSDNPFFKSKYADFSSIIDVAKKPLADNGLSFVQLPSYSDGLITLMTILMHSSGQWISGDAKLKSKDETAQAVGSGITYAKRYGIASALGIASEEDDDGNHASASSPMKPTTNAAAPKPVVTGNAGEYIIPFGKFKGQSLSTISPKQLESYVCYLIDTARKADKPMNPSAQELVQRAEAYLAQFDEASPIPPAGYDLGVDEGNIPF